MINKIFYIIIDVISLVASNVEMNEKKEKHFNQKMLELKKTVDHYQHKDDDHKKADE